MDQSAEIARLTAEVETLTAERDGSFRAVLTAQEQLDMAREAAAPLEDFLNEPMTVYAGLVEPSAVRDYRHAAYRKFEVLHNALAQITPGADGPQSGSFQARVAPWMKTTFGPEISSDQVERGDRLIEEVYELLQAQGYDRRRLPLVENYVWDRPVGEPAQEVGGVMITLAALCLASGLDMHEEGEAELTRIWTMVEKIRAKQKTKPKHDPRPMPSPEGPQDTAPDLPPSDVAAIKAGWRISRKYIDYDIPTDAYRPVKP